MLYYPNYKLWLIITYYQTTNNWNLFFQNKFLFFIKVLIYLTFLCNNAGLVRACYLMIFALQGSLCPWCEYFCCTAHICLSLECLSIGASRTLLESPNTNLAMCHPKLCHWFPLVTSAPRSLAIPYISI